MEDESSADASPQGAVTDLTGAEVGAGVFSFEALAAAAAADESAALLAAIAADESAAALAAATESAVSSARWAAAGAC